MFVQMINDEGSKSFLDDRKVEIVNRMTVIDSNLGCLCLNELKLKCLESINGVFHHNNFKTHTSLIN